jgi:hypothetical protein
MLKTTNDSIKNPQSYDDGSKGKEKEEALDASQGKMFLMSSRALSLRQKVSLSVLLIRNAFTATRRDIGSRTVRSTWKSRRRRRKVRLQLQV